MKHRQHHINVLMRHYQLHVNVTNAGPGRFAHTRSPASMNKAQSLLLVQSRASIFPMTESTSARIHTAIVGKVARTGTRG